MTTVLGILGCIALVAFIVFTFRQGFQVKSDKNRKVEDWPRITQGGGTGQ